MTPEWADRSADEEPRQPAEIVRLNGELRAARRQLDVKERQLERSEARFRDIIERNADAIVVVESSGTIRFANRAAGELFATPCEGLIGSDFGFPVVAGETIEIDVLAGGEPRVAEMRVVRSEWDGLDAHIATLRDVTERKRAESDARRLIQSEAARVASVKAAKRFQLLAEVSAALSSTLDISSALDGLAQRCVREIADWVVIYAMNGDPYPHRLQVRHKDPSKAEVTRQLCEIPIDARGVHPVLEVLKSRRSVLQREVSDDGIARMSTNPREIELMRKLGVRSYMHVPMVARDHPLGAIMYVRGADSELFGADDLVLAEQLTARAAIAVDNARLYEEANRANQTKADFLAVVSHDLRTPLTAIIGYSDLLLMGVPHQLPDSAAERVDRIRASARHLLYLMNELLSFARLDAGREELRPTDVDLCELVRDVQTVVEPLAQEKQLALVLDLPDGTAHAKTDADKVRQILLNLVGNAIKYTGDGGVTVRLYSADSHVNIHVQDTGRGIDPAHLDRIFEPFWQAEPAQRSQGGGTGLGLSVVKRLAGLLGGRIDVRSSIGAGSIFTLSLPVTLHEEADQRESPSNV